MCPISKVTRQLAEIVDSSAGLDERIGVNLARAAFVEAAKKSGTSGPQNKLRISSLAGERNRFLLPLIGTAIPGSCSQRKAGYWIATVWPCDKIQSRRREACSNQAFAASLSCISRMTIVKTSTSYFACTSPAITAATLSSIWFQPSI